MSENIRGKSRTTAHCVNVHPLKMHSWMLLSCLRGNSHPLYADRCSNKSDLAKHTAAHQRGTTRGNEETRRSKRKSYQPLPPTDAQRADPTNGSLPTVERDVAKAEPASGGEEQTRQPTDDVTSMALDFKSPSASEGPVEPTENFKHDTHVTEVTRTEETILSV